VISEAFDRSLRERFGVRVQRDRPLAPLTTFKVGGPADWLLDVRDADELRDALALAALSGVPVVVLGGGSNVLIADGGIRGLVVRLRGSRIAQVDPDHIRADAGVTINGLVRWTISNGLGGLEAWAGTPGTVGGAVHGNAHFKGRLVGDLISAATLMTRDGRIHEVARGAMAFGYDDSRLQHTGEILLSADFVVSPAEPAALREVARASLAFRKRTQPLASSSAGCIFQNPDPRREAVPAGIPPSAGALVDRAGLKGSAHGRARVSSSHGNFIVNEGGAAAEDIRRLIAQCKSAVHAAFGVVLREEIIYLGFDGGGPARVEHGDAQD
jgi:UDP-N-acetylmuramate dehydrogenase